METESTGQTRRKKTGSVWQVAWDNKIAWVIGQSGDWEGMIGLWMEPDLFLVAVVQCFTQLGRTIVVEAVEPSARESTFRVGQAPKVDLTMLGGVFCVQVSECTDSNADQACVPGIGS